ncbi:cytochrome P450 2U1-like [Gigantopelta aegis]|uniref:cytochrome P450 2U1-like n=1 Tax=Gigantopelta aegis TaxID=1735272 RepID=UPI001B88B4D9|nr:cytochrome P450 2U1-like [Gigantopelta aegis]
MSTELVTDSMSVLVVLVTVLLSVWWYTRRPSDIPPGPWLTLPVFGNFFQLGRHPVKSLRELRKKYGDVFSVYFGSRLAIFINGFDNIKEVLVKKADVFSDRPHMFTLDMISKDMGILGSNGLIWKEQRKLALVTLKNLGMGRNILQEKIQVEITALVTELTKTKGDAIDLRHIVCTSVSNVISSMVFGKRFEFDDPKFVQFLKVSEESISIPIVIAFFPFLRFLPGDPFRFKHIAHDVDRVLTDLVDTSLEDHIINYDDDNINDFISAYIKEMKAVEKLGNTKSSIDRENLRMTIWNLFIAGTETTATTIRWIVLYFLHFPEIQEKCFAEIQKVGYEREISLKDKPELPYLEATILETLRYADIVPLGIRSTSSEVTFKGFRIPKDTIIMPVIDSVMSDPEIWGDPENFRPDRFLDGNGRVVKPEAVNVAFAVGPRNCLGESLARMELFLFMATMIQKFEFVKAEGCSLPTMESVYGVTQAPQPYNVRVVLREGL